MRFKKNRPYNDWLKSQRHYLSLPFFYLKRSEPIRFTCDMRLKPLLQLKGLCQSVISGSLTLRNTKIRGFGMKFNFSKIRMEPVMLSFLATTENIKYKIRTAELQLRESCQKYTVGNCYSQYPA